MLKKLGLIILCCLMLVACGDDGLLDKINEQRPEYAGEYGDVLNQWYFDTYFRGCKVPDDFVTKKMAADIKKVIKAHKKIKGESEESPIDEETALDIAMAVIMNFRPSFFEEPTVYRITYRPDDDVYYIWIADKSYQVGVLDGGIDIRQGISRKDGTPLYYWVQG